MEMDLYLKTMRHTCCMKKSAKMEGSGTHSKYVLAREAKIHGYSLIFSFIHVNYQSTSSILPILMLAMISMDSCILLFNDINIMG